MSGTAGRPLQHHVVMPSKANKAIYNYLIPLDRVQHALVDATITVNQYFDSAVSPTISEPYGSLERVQIMLREENELAAASPTGRACASISAASARTERAREPRPRETGRRACARPRTRV